MTDFAEVINFWFSEPVKSKWFRSTVEFDAELKHRYEALWKSGCARELDNWQDHAKGALALVILLDQFPLNMYRDSPLGYSSEAQARDVSRLAIQQGFDKNLQNPEKAFLYMPFMHSEDIEDQNISVSLHESGELENNLRFARHHQEIIRRFGRFPHRNKVLGRESTPEEISYLNSKEAFNPD
jgi:uncharacterized protein (DUF924 family)